MNTSDLSRTLRIMSIVDGTTVDGPGFRTSIYFAGCEHHCYNCHNPSTWPIDAGETITVGELMERIISNDMNVTFSGGDPLLQIDPLLILADEITKAGKTIWCYTGYTYEHVANHPKLCKILEKIEVLVDGPYIDSLRNTELIFRGSENQRLILTHKSNPSTVTEWCPEF